MKKWCLVLTVNIGIFTLLLFSLNYLLLKDDNIYKDIPDLYKKYFKRDLPTDTINKILWNIQEYEVPNKYIEPFVAKRLDLNDKSLEQFCGTERIRNNVNFEGNPIVVMGCSYAYGHGLKTKDTFPYLLSLATHRPVYNTADCGQNALYSINFIKEKGLQNEVKNADYFVYIYMWNHLARYLSNNVLIPYHDSLLNLSKFELFLAKIPVFKYFIVTVHKRLILKGYPFSDSSHDYLTNIIKFINTKIKEISPTAKFIIIIYNEKIPDNTVNPDIMLIYDYDFWKKIEKTSGAIVVFTQDITGIKFDKEYKLKEDIADWHPNSKAWQLFTKPFAEKYIK